jgi:hypothetical protein
LNQEINKEKSLIESMYKREIIAGIMGAFFVFIVVAAYYVWNIMHGKKGFKKRIN